MKLRLFLLISLLSIRSFGQAVPPPAGVVDLDTLMLVEYVEYTADSLLKQNPVTDHVLEKRTFEKPLSARYSGPDYDYATVKPHKSFWQKLMERVDRLLRRIFGEVNPQENSEFTANLLRVVAVVIIAFVLYFLIRFLMGKEGNFFFSRKNKKINLPNADLRENIHEIDFPKSISGFERSHDFRSAIRYHFLFVLKKLSDKKQIAWHPEKTNQDYFSELKNEAAKDQFAELVYVFDYVWYGEFEISEEQYLGFARKFTGFNF